MSSVITTAGRTRMNQLAGEESPLVIDRMVLAMIPDLDTSAAADPDQQLPDAEYIVYTYGIPSDYKGYVDADQVVYSMMLGPDIGEFSFNWIGLLEADTDTVITVTVTPPSSKWATDLATNTTGNMVTRNVILSYQDAQNLTGITVAAEAWQLFQGSLNTHIALKVDPTSDDDTTLKHLTDAQAKVWDEHAASKIRHGSKNILINGCFRVNQRDVSGTVSLSAGEYGHDRWRAGNSGCTYTFETVENGHTLTITSGTLEQEIEGANIGDGAYTLSWIGTAQGCIDSGDSGDSGDVTEILTGGTNSVVSFGTGTLAFAQLEPGSVATSFKLRPLSFEYMLCWRYGFLLYPGSFGYSNSASTLIHISAALPVPLRTTPTLSVPGPDIGLDNLYAGQVWYGTDPFIKTIGSTAVVIGFSVSGVMAGQIHHHTYNNIFLEAEL